MNDGWIKLHRQIADNWLWNDKPFSRGQAWMDLVLKANHKDGGFWKRGIYVEVKRGQTGRSEVQLASDWGWSRNKVRRFMTRLKTDTMVEQQTEHLTSVISICNYDKYNPPVKQQTIQQTKQQKDNRRYINKNEKKEKNNKDTNVSLSVSNETTRSIYEFYLKAFGQSESRYKLTEARKRKLTARVRENGSDALKRAITAVSNSPFHCGENDRGWKADLDFIIRTYEQVEKFANMEADVKPISIEEALNNL